MRCHLLGKCLLFVLLVLLCAACGYHREGQHSLAPRPRLYIELFANETHRAFVNDQLTAQLIERFARSPLFAIVETPGEADLLLAGVVTAYETAPLAYNQQDTISAYKAEITVRATLRRPGAAQEVLWRKNLSSRHDYTSNNPDLVLPESVERLANDLYTQVTDTLFWGGIKEGS